MEQLKALSESGVPVLPAMTTLAPGQYLESPSKRYKLLLQQDSNLVLFDGGVSIWVANDGQAHSTIYRFKKLRDVPHVEMVYYLRVVQPQWKQTWSSVGYSSLGNDYQSAKHRAFLSLQDDGNIVVVDRQPVWAHNKSLWEFSTSPVGQVFDSGFQMSLGQVFTAGGARLEFRSDGNLIALNAAGQATWATNTSGRGVNRAVMQEDGNFVLFSDAGPVWETHTAGQVGAFAQLQENGNFSLAQYKAVWARFGIVQHKRRKNKIFGPFDIPVLKVFDFIRG